jgi:amino acid adenylation domain-containing protein
MESRFLREVIQSLSTRRIHPKIEVPKPTALDVIAMNNLDSVVNGVEMPFPRERSVVNFFHEQVHVQPDALAVKDAGRSMTYGELDVCSNRVANELCRRGLKLEESVAILIPASVEYVVAMLGILKAGGSYLPIDPDVPAKRMEFLLQDSGSRLAMANAVSIKLLDEWPGTALDLAQIISKPDAEACKISGVSSDPNRRAYIIYTSGSTGQPKGVEIEHHSLTNLVCYYGQRLNLTAQDRASMLSYVAFDSSVADIWPTLCSGGIVIVPPKGILLNPDGLIKWLEKEEITFAFVPTGLAEILFNRPWPLQMKLRFLITGGDRLRVRPPDGLQFIVINGYGPTENTVFSTWAVVSPVNGTGQPPTIGRPISNITAYVLDEYLQPVSVDIVGELYLGGEQVARSYLGRPELTKECFLPDPFVGKPNARMYRTGDWVRWLADGELDFCGRKDGQIQIRGRRVELGEIEATLFAHDAVRQVCCVPWLDEGMPSGVIAHIVPKIISAAVPDELRAYLGTCLPDYMVPSEFVLHTIFPLTPQGKIDRAALMALHAAKPASSRTLGGDGLEKALAQLWHSLLPAAEGSSADTAFAVLGGDSLQAIKLMLGVEEITGQRLEISSFLVKPTFAGLCEAVRARMGRNEFEPVLALRKQGARPPLFCLYGHTGDIEMYFNLAKALGDDQPVIGIRSPALKDLSRLPKSIEEAAAEVVCWIRKVQPQGAPALIGYSWAGLLAFEVARQLAKAEQVHCFTAMIGTDAPMRETNVAFRLAHFARHFPFWLWNLITDNKHRRRRLMRWREMVQGTKQNLAETRLPVEDWDWVSSPISLHMICLMEKYHPFPIPDFSIEVFRERDEFRSFPHPLRAWQLNHLPDGGWNRWTRRPNHIHWLEGNHVTIIKPPAVYALAQSIRQAMDQHYLPSAPALEIIANTQ